MKLNNLLFQVFSLDLDHLEWSKYLTNLQDLLLEFHWLFSH